MDYWEQQRIERDEKERKLQEFLKSIKVGDLVAQASYHPYYGKTWSIYKVTRFTKARIFVRGPGVREIDIDRKTGNFRGDYRGTVEPVTPEIMQYCRRGHALDDVSHMLLWFDQRSNLNKLTMDEATDLQALLAAIKAAHPEAPRE
jgi:hypothetical protein